MYIKGDFQILKRKEKHANKNQKDKLVYTSIVFNWVFAYFDVLFTDY